MEKENSLPWHGTKFPLLLDLRARSSFFHSRYPFTRVHEDLDAFLPERIAPFDLVVFYYTLGEIKEAQKRGLMNHIAAGKGYVTFHSGADSFRGDPDYAKSLLVRVS